MTKALRELLRGPEVVSSTVREAKEAENAEEKSFKLERWSGITKGGPSALGKVLSREASNASTLHRSRLDRSHRLAAGPRPVRDQVERNGDDAFRAAAT